jgi:hypothetical protein
MDLGFFLDGARAVADHGTPYAAEMYVYSPLLALALGSAEGPADVHLGWWTALSLAAGIVAVCPSVGASAVGPGSPPSLCSAFAGTSDTGSSQVTRAVSTQCLT